MKINQIIKGFKEDGTHPDFPVKKEDNLEKLNSVPAIVVYPSHIGKVYAISNTTGGVSVHVKSEYKGKTEHHLIDKSPSGEQPLYLLLKEYHPMKNAP